MKFSAESLMRQMKGELVGGFLSGRYLLNQLDFG